MTGDKIYILVKSVKEDGYSFHETVTETHESDRTLLSTVSTIMANPFNRDAEVEIQKILEVDVVKVTIIELEPKLEKMKLTLVPKATEAPTNKSNIRL